MQVAGCVNLQSIFKSFKSPITSHHENKMILQLDNFEFMFAEYWITLDLKAAVPSQSDIYFNI